MRPMLAVRGTRPPEGADWRHEVKWDGVRALVEVTEAGALIRTRNGNDVTGAFPELSGLRVLRGDEGVVDCLLDGEVVVLADGTPSFAAVASRLHRAHAAEAGTGPALLVVFDVIAVQGQDLTALPLRDRRTVLEGLSFAGGLVQLSPLHEDGALLLEATRLQGLEGIVSKRLSSPYRAGQRSEDWLKFPHRRRTSWVVGGWTIQEGSAGRLAALLVGEPVEGGLTYQGKVGTGFTHRSGAALVEVLSGLRVEESPFLSTDLPRGTSVTWVRPEVVVEVESLGRTASGKLRQPSFVGVRSDVGPAEVPGA